MPPPNSDIQVQVIGCTPPVLCNCPLDVKLTLVNRGSANPTPPSADGKFEVCLTSPAFDPEFQSTYRQRVPVGEGGGLFPPRTPYVVTFRNVIFRNPGRQTVTACADCQGVHPRSGRPQFEIGNNLHTNPCLSIDVDVSPAGCLQVERVAVDAEDSRGNRFRDVGVLCVGARFVVTARINNRGCAAALNVPVRLDVLGGNLGVLWTMTQVIPTVNPLVPVSIEFRGNVPAASSVGSSEVFRVCLDATTQLLQQCRLQRLCLASSPIPLAPSGGPGPTAVLILNEASTSPILPGEQIALSWLIRNDCSDLGEVTARVILKETGDVLYDSAASGPPIPAPPQGTAGEQSKFITRPADARVAGALYRIGARTLVISVTGTGQNPGPYTAEATVLIAGETVDGSWWSWVPPAPPPEWKDSFEVTGVFTHRGLGGEQLSVTGATFRELDLDASPPAITDTFSVSSSSTGLAAGESATFVSKKITKQWEWFDSDTATVNGPLQKTFGYEAEVAFADTFGNGYILEISEIDILNALGLKQVMPVGNAKQMLLTEAYHYWKGGIELLVASLVATAIPIIGFALAAYLLVEALRSFSLYKRLVKQTGDPPVPDFDHARVVPLEPEPLPPNAPALPEDLFPLRSLAELLSRAHAAIEALDAIKSKMLGARIDDNPTSLGVQAESYDRALRLLTMVGAHLPGTVVEVIWALNARNALPTAAAIAEARQLLLKQGVPPRVKSLWKELGLPAGELDRMVQGCRAFRGPFVAGTLESALGTIADAVVKAGRRAHDERPG